MDLDDALATIRIHARLHKLDRLLTRRVRLTCVWRPSFGPNPITDTRTIVRMRRDDD